MAIDNHEQAFVERFVRPNRRPRHLALLANDRKRTKFIGQLAHFRDFDQRYTSLIPPEQQSAALIHSRLVKAGADATCYVFSEDKQLDAREMPLREALDATVGTCMATIISCIPGRLAYYEGETPGRRYLLRNET